MSLHHAIVYEGDRAAGMDEARRYVQEVVCIPYLGNPDVIVTEWAQFTIEEARGLKDRASRCAFGTAQVFVVVFDRITIQAQNALLKILEEPAQHTHLIFIVPTLEQLLPTVRSRLYYGGRVRTERPSEYEYAETFLRASLEDRSALLTPFTRKVSDAEKQSQRSRASRVLDAMERILGEQGSLRHADALREILFVRRYLNDTSSSLKMLFEHLAVTLGQIG